MHRPVTFARVLSALMLGACGTTTQERAVSGGGLGAATGAAVGAVTDASMLGAGLLGAVAGAAAGALTEEEQVDLGEPVWE